LYNRKKWTGWELNPRPQQRTLVLAAIEFLDYYCIQSIDSRFNTARVIQLLCMIMFTPN
jgi:hypothetical protein